LQSGVDFFLDCPMCFPLALAANNYRACAVGGQGAQAVSSLCWLAKQD
jgi:hypothetical protein